MPSNILAIIPAYNEEESLKGTIDELKTKAPFVDFVVINDGSTDGTKQICIDNEYPFINMPVNGGLTVGFRTGMKYADRKHYDYALQFDADGQHMPEYIESMLECMRSSQADIVIGSRYVTEKKNHSLRMIGSRLITELIKITSGFQLMDPTSGLRLYNKKMIHQFACDPVLNPEPESLAYLIRQGAIVRETQVSMRDRIAGESYLSFSKSITYMLRACSSILFFQWFRR